MLQLFVSTIIFSVSGTSPEVVACPYPLAVGALCPWHCLGFVDPEEAVHHVDMRRLFSLCGLAGGFYSDANRGGPTPVIYY